MEPQNVYDWPEYQYSDATVLFNKPFRLLLLSAILVLSAFFCGCHEHEWIPATCIAPKTCAVCGKTEGDKGEHGIPAHSCTEDVTCSVCGAVFPAQGHKLTDVTCFYPKHCTVCGMSFGEPLSHTVRHGYCSLCGKKIYETNIYVKDGDNIISDMDLPFEMYKITFANTGSHNFVVTAYDRNGAYSDLLVNEIGNYCGSSIITNELNGGSLEVKSSGRWAVIIESMDSSSGTSCISGNGDWVSPYFNLQPGLLPVSMYNTGSHNFIVTLWNDRGRRCALLANEIGEYIGTVAFNEGEYLTKYCIEVKSSGEWCVDFGLGSNATSNESDVVSPQDVITYCEALGDFQNGNFSSAKNKFSYLGTYRNSDSWVSKCDERMTDLEHQVEP